jgi:hypothetical protein
VLNIDEVGIVHPEMAMPGALAIASSGRNVERLRALQGAGSTLYRVRAVIGPHIPLTGSVGDIVSLSPSTGLSVNDPPLSMYLHHGGRTAVFFDLEAKEDGTLAAIGVDVQADDPSVAFSGARTAVNELLDVLMRRIWLPLLLVRLDLIVGGEDKPFAHELHVPFVGELSIGPIGGIHQYPLFSELESLAREAICSSSPFYRFLCAFRLYDGLGALRTRLNDMRRDLGVEAPLPKDEKVDAELIEKMGLVGFAQSSTRTAGALHGRLTRLRDMASHFILIKGEKAPPLHIGDGLSYRTYSAAAAVMLHYGFAGLRSLASYFQQHLGPRVLQGSVLPMAAQRDIYRVVVNTTPDTAS